MTKEEFKAWMKVTKSSRTKWVLDEVLAENQGEYMFYKGGVNGVYILITSSGNVSIGTYEGAIPHIMEAEFTQKHSKQVADNADTAAGIVLEKLGVAFLINWLT